MKFSKCESTFLCFNFYPKSIFRESKTSLLVNCMKIYKFSKIFKIQVIKYNESLKIQFAQIRIHRLGNPFIIKYRYFEYFNCNSKFIFCTSKNPLALTVIEFRGLIEFFQILGRFFNFRILRTTFVRERGPSSIVLFWKNSSKEPDYRVFVPGLQPCIKYENLMYSVC